jgi:apolipoprotein N-acyltransferase
MIAAIWVGFEWFHGTWPLGGLAWGYLGQSQTPALALCQIADITGVFGVSFVVVMVNAWVSMLALRWPRLSNRVARAPAEPGSSGAETRGSAGASPSRSGSSWALIPAGLAVAVALAANLGYGLFRLSQHPTTPGPRVLVVQPSYPQSNNGEKGASPREILEFHVRMTRKALADNPSVDLVVWSETMMPPINQESLDYARIHSFEVSWDQARQQVAALSREFKVEMLVGGVYYDQWGIKGDRYVPADRRNSAYFFTPAGMENLRYDKIHLVPFGETLPFKTGFPPLYALFVSLSPYSDEFTLTAGPADAMTVFQMRQGWRFVSPICFEDLDGPLLRRMLAPQDGRKRADFIVNITNDGWFKVNEMPQHLENAVFRSIENRVPTARSVNAGVSGFIDSSGRTSGVIGAWREGVSVETLTLDSRITFYARFGDVFAYLCAAASAVLLVVTLVRWWRK